MSDTRIYRGYIIPNRKSLLGNSFLIQFPDFPEISISVGNEIFKNSTIAYELSFTEIVDEIIELVESGREIPMPQPHVDYKLVVDLEVDVEEICQHLCLKLAT